MPRPTRVILIVLDSVGSGELPDAASYGDAGQRHARQHRAAVGLRVPTLRRLGLGSASARVPAIGAVEPLGAFGRMAEASPGKDSVTGHWELMGLVLDRAVPDVSRTAFRRT